MTAMRDKTMANDPQNRAAPGMGWPVAIFIGTAMLAGGFAGYNRAAAETGGPALSPWIGALIATALGVTAFGFRSEEHTSELQSLMRISYAVFCLKKTTTDHNTLQHQHTQQTKQHATI